MKNCPMCEGVGCIYAGHFQTWEGLVALYELCEACRGTGVLEEDISLQDRHDYAPLMELAVSAQIEVVQ